MIHPALLKKYDYQSRFQKARKIERILLGFFGETRKAKDLRCLDLGCSIGVISTHLADVFGHVVGVEQLDEAIEIARRLDSGGQVSFVHGDALDLSFEDEAFDVIVCAQVYEHTQDPARLVSEIRRVLTPGGCCFFSGPNSLWPIEYHYGWCCLHWMPRPLVDLYCRYRYAHTYDLVLYNYWQLRRLWKGFECYDYTLQLIYDPGQFLGSPDPYSAARLVPRSVASVFRFLLPNFNWVLLKV